MTRLGETSGAQLRALWQRSGLSMAKLAKKMGYKNSSGIQRYLSDEYGGTDPLDVELAIKFGRALAGTGSPAIDISEVLELAGVEVTESGTLRALTVDGALSIGTREFAPEAFSGAKIPSADLLTSILRILLTSGPEGPVQQAMLPVYGSTLRSVLIMLQGDPEIGDDPAALSRVVNTAMISSREQFRTQE